MQLTVVDEDLLDQHVDCIVNAWNRNLFPWWLLLPQGVSGAIKRGAGLAPFKELRRFGILPLGGAVVTGPGRLPVRAIIHVAGIGLTWRASEKSVRLSARNAVELAKARGYRSLAFPLIGAGTGALKPARVEQLMIEELSSIEFDADVRIVRFRPSR